ncbi:hypothetical protein CWE13_11535 [Aliidiomarina shirensis]|uniref:DUF945 domain-containing protein n=1 Tax=Aliidiomarina shirensis TaxID=1048642 RepID=A0A432WP43_9GAMM|nr:DUF945 family protein [Aliidiomarina shirensis]RUO35554.1 hypothetical protein CWE13_11535 [Aliidiomarina shirensis]
MRKGLIAIIVIVLAVIAYVAGVVTTKKATYQAVETLVEEVERNSQWAVEVDWQEEGARNATVVFRMEMDEIPDLDFALYYEETIQLSYGFLNTKWEGSGDVTFGDKKMSELLYEGSPFTSSGVVSRGGLRVTYDFPAINLLDEGFAVQANPMQMHFVMAGEERRFNFDAPEVTLVGENNEGVTLSALAMNSDSRILDGEVFSSDSAFTMGKMEMNLEVVGAPIVVTGLKSTLNTLRVDEEIRVDGMFVLESLDAGPTVKGNARLDWAVEGINYDEMMALNEALQEPDLSEEEMGELFLHAMAASDNVLIRFNELFVSGEGWGDLVSHGTFGFDFADLSDSEKVALLQSPEFAQHVDVDLVIEKMPGMLQMMMMAFTSDDLPWNVRFADGALYINDEMVDLSAMQQ